MVLWMSMIQPQPVESGTNDTAGLARGETLAVPVTQVKHSMFPGMTIYALFSSNYPALNSFAALHCGDTNLGQQNLS